MFFKYAGPLNTCMLFVFIRKSVPLVNVYHLSLPQKLSAIVPHVFQ